MTPEDKLFKNMFEMALTRKEALDSFSDEVFQVFSHLIKILHWEDSNSFNHHLVDLTSFQIKSAKELYKYDGNLSPDQIYFQTKINQYCNKSSVIKEIKRLTPKYNKLRETSLNVDVITSELIKVFKILSVDLSNKINYSKSFRITNYLSTDVQAYLYQLNSYEGK